MNGPDLPEGHRPVPTGCIAAVVTWLELDRPPPPERPRWPRGVGLERATAPDPARYRRLFVEIGRDWLWFGRLRLAPEALARLLADPRLEIGIVRHEGRDIGLVELDFRPGSEAELAYFGFVRSWIGRGLGGAAMRWALARAFARPIRRLVVRTCTLDHPDALAFYRRFGFRPWMRTVEIAPDPRLVGLLPRDAAPQVPILAPAADHPSGSSPP